MSSDLDAAISKADAAPIEGPVDFATTGLVGLDWALGGGVARGRLIEFSGLESSGKSTIGLQTAISEARRLEKPALWFDYEYAWDPEYVAGLGGDDSLFRVAQPISIEKGFELAQKALEEEWVSSVWFDSTGAMVSEEKGVATSARAFAQHLPHLTRSVARAAVACGFVSQTREVLQTGFGGGWGQGPKRRATGGTALKFYFSQRVEFTMIRRLKGKGATVTGAEADSVIGRRVRARVIKNKVAVPYREIELDVIDGFGFDPVAHMLELALELKVVKKKGSFYEIPGVARSVQGSQNVLKVLHHPKAEPVLVDMSRQVHTLLDEVGRSRSVETSEPDVDEEAGDGSDDD